MFICTELWSNPPDQIALQGVFRDRDGTLTRIFLQEQSNLKVTKDKAVHCMETARWLLILSFSSVKVISVTNKKELD